MPEVSEDARSYPERSESGPNYFGYYKHAILELFSQNEDFLSHFTSQDPESSSGVPAKDRTEGISNYSSSTREAKSCSSDSLFSAGIEGLSVSNRETLKAFLKQSVIDLNQEVDEMLGRVLAINQIRAHLSKKEPSVFCSGASIKNKGNNLCKKQKRSSSPLSNFTHGHLRTDGCQSADMEADHDFQSLLEINGLQSEEDLKRRSDDLLAKLENMEQCLEEFLDIIISKCRPVNQAEKQQLRRRIQKLPAKSLDRAVEIIQHKKPPERVSCDEIRVDLETEDNMTLWRLHYYAEAVEGANELTL